MADSIAVASATRIAEATYSTGPAGALRADDRISPPAVSVVVPVHNDAAHLRLCLKALAASTCGDFEVLVVDDASTDDTPAVAAEFGARLVRLGQKSGPAAARNAGAAQARGEYVLFVDADVCVHPDTIARVAATFEAQQGVAAVFGSYDRHPGEPNLLSQYKNLFHHFVHQQAHREAATFWAGCGAVRRAIFLEAGGFDERYRRPCVEDIELGMRLVAAGHRVVLEKAIQVQHLKRWNLWSMVQTDVADRAIPWTELIFRDRSLPDDLNLKRSQRLCALMAAAAPVALLLGAWHWPGLLLLAAMALLLVLLVDRCNLDTSGSPRPRSRSGRVRFARLPGLAVRASFGAGALGSAVLIGTLFGWWALLPLPAVLGVVWINRAFYAFLLRERGAWFAAVSLPLHLLYYNYSLLSFACGAGLAAWRPIGRALRSSITRPRNVRRVEA
jgi:glycosyltransferase involved in cell wall biosynthesis